MTTVQKTSFAKFTRSIMREYRDGALFNFCED